MKLNLTSALRLPQNPFVSLFPYLSLAFIQPHVSQDIRSLRYVIITFRGDLKVAVLFWIPGIFCGNKFPSPLLLITLLPHNIGLICNRIHLRQTPLDHPFQILHQIVLGLHILTDLLSLRSQREMFKRIEGNVGRHLWVLELFCL